MARDGAIASPRRGAECAARFSAAPNVFEKSEANTSIIKANKKEGGRRVADGREPIEVKIGSNRFRRKHHSRPSQAIFSAQRTRPNPYECSLVFLQTPADRPKRVRFQAAEPPKNSAWVEQRFVIPKVKNSGHFVQNSGHSSVRSFAPSDDAHSDFQ